MLVTEVNYKTKCACLTVRELSNLKGKIVTRGEIEKKMSVICMNYEKIS